MSPLVDAVRPEQFQTQSVDVPGGREAGEVPRDPVHPGVVLGGRYRLLEPLGQGGMGRVFRALDLRLVRPVALKLLREPWRTNRLERFRREALLGVTVNHPGVVRLLDAGCTEAGQPFLVMELVEGARPLDEALEGAAPERVLEVVRRVVEAVGALHARGIVHRDVKGANVLLDQDDQVKVCDFGLSWREGDGRLTLSRQSVGTPIYMAPEALRGRVDPDPRRDVYALGVLLYRLLSGRFPFQGQTPVELAANALRGRPPALSELVPGVSPALESVCSRALAVDPERRYPDALALAEALREVPESGRQEEAPRAARTLACRRPRRRPASPGTWGRILQALGAWLTPAPQARRRARRLVRRARRDGAGYSRP